MVDETVIQVGKATVFIWAGGDTVHILYQCSKSIQDDVTVEPSDESDVDRSGELESHMWDDPCFECLRLAVRSGDSTRFRFVSRVYHQA